MEYEVRSKATEAAKRHTKMQVKSWETLADCLGIMEGYNSNS